MVDVENISYTGREKQIIKLLILGFVVKEICDLIGNSKHTTKTQVSILRGKLNACSETVIVAKALSSGFTYNLNTRIVLYNGQAIPVSMAKADAVLAAKYKSLSGDY